MSATDSDSETDNAAHGGRLACLVSAPEVLRDDGVKQALAALFAAKIACENADWGRAETVSKINAQTLVRWIENSIR